MSPPKTTYTHYLASKGQSTSSIQSNQKNLYHYLTWCEDEHLEPENATHNHLITYIRHLQKRSVKQITVQHHINSIKHYYNWHIEKETLHTNPCQNLQLKGIQRTQLYHLLKPQELEQLYENYTIPEATTKTANQNWFKAQQLAAKRNKVMLGLLIWQGLNTTELFALSTQDLKLREGKLQVTGTRRSNPRTLKLESVQIMDLMEYTLQIRKELLAQTKKETEQLFISGGKGKQPKGIMQKLMQTLKKQNPKVDHANQIRTSVITHWLKQYNLRQVQYMAGHKYVSSTEAYQINDLEQLSEELEKYHPM